MTSERAFFGAMGLLFIVSTLVTVVWCTSMSGMEGMPMPGGWALSMSWMRMPGQSWPGVAVSFLAMWVVMMVAMMLPSLTPMLYRYRRTMSTTSQVRLDRLTLLVGLGYFFVWTVLGFAVFVVGVASAGIVMQVVALARAVPLIVGCIVLLAGVLQLTRWKAHQLACCRRVPSCDHLLASDMTTAWNYGLRLGLRCSYCCAGLTMILLAIGVMDLYAMTILTVVITIERLSPAGERVARGLGILIIGYGMYLMLRASGLADAAALPW